MAYWLVLELILLFYGIHAANPGYNIFLKQIRDAARNSKGLPLAVQVAALPFEEEKCLAVMREIERLWQHKKTPKNSQWTTNE